MTAVAVGGAARDGGDRPGGEIDTRAPDPGRRRDFRLLWIGQGATSLGSSVTGVALPLVAVAALDAGAFQVALLSAAAWLPWLLIGLPAGPGWTGSAAGR